MNHFAAYAGKQLLRSASLLLAVSILSFLLIVSSPVDPVEAFIGPDKAISLQQRRSIEQYWGLDKPPLQRYFVWLRNLFHGDLGQSMVYRQSVARVIRERFTASLALTLTAWVLSGVVGFALGTLAGLHEGSLYDRGLRGFCLMMTSAPGFWIGILILMLFVVHLGWFPMGMAVPLGKLRADVTVWDRIYHMILPAFTMTLTGLPNITLHTREKTVSVLQSEYVLFARARGESRWQVLRRHGFRNVAIPAITVQFAGFSHLFGGSLLAEEVFSYPGLGSATVAAATKGDVPLLLALALCSALFVFVGNTAANLLYGVLDPRTREKEGGCRHA